MFANFIPLIIVLLIYTTYPIPAEPAWPLAAVLPVALFSVWGLWRLAQWRFGRLITTGHCSGPYKQERAFDKTLHQLTIGAVLLIAGDLYLLDLPFFLSRLPLFSQLPTLGAVIFAALFIIYLVLIWMAAHPARQRVLHISTPLKTFIRQQLAFTLPLLLPWLLLSGSYDLLLLLPFDGVKRLFASDTGEIFFSLVFLLITAIFGPYFIQRLWGCKPLENPYWRDRIEQLAQKTGCRFTEILYWPVFGGKMITAGVMGLAARFRYLLVTQALFDYLSPAEIDAVIAHEAGHIKHHHLYLYLFFFAGYLVFHVVLFAFADLLLVALIPLENPMDAKDLAPVVTVLVTVMAVVTFVFYFRYIFGYFMRNFERQADIFALTLTGSAKPLITTFQKIAITSGQSPDKPNWHHYSLTERMDYLKKCEEDKRWIARHEHKIRRGMGVFILCLATFGSLGYGFEFGGLKQQWQQTMVAARLEKALDSGTPQPELISALADIYFEAEKFEKARQHYERALQLAPDNANILNNLAWFYATCADARLQQPQRALDLAQKAAARLRAPHVYDTLAEACYVNHQYQAAFNASRKALWLAGRNQPYYVRQLEKFRKKLAFLGNQPQLEI